MIKQREAFVLQPMIYSETARSDRHYFFCHVAAVLSSAGFICVEKCHLAQAAKALSETEAGGGGIMCAYMQHVSIDLRMLEMDSRQIRMFLTKRSPPGSGNTVKENILTSLKLNHRIRI